MLIAFVAGVGAGALIVYILLARLKREMRLRDDEVEHLRQQKELVVRFMHEMVEALGAGVERGELFQRIAVASVRCTGATSACIYELQDDGKLHGVAVEGLFPPQLPVAHLAHGKAATRARFIEQVLRAEQLEPGTGIMGVVAVSGEGLLVADATGDARIIRHGDAALEVRSLIAMPILARGRVAGVLAVANPPGGGMFSETEFSLVRSMAEQAGLALQNSELLAIQIEKRQMDVDLGLARDIQRMLVPERIPESAGLQIEVRYQPAKHVGGDLVDVIERKDGRLAVIVADVAGKGVGASILMAMCRTHLRHALKSHDSPAAVLRAVNSAMADEMRPGMFVTILLAIVDTAGGRITFARAGHEAPLIARAGAGQRTVCEFPHAEGMAVGITDPAMFDAVITEGSIPFQAGDALVLYTDGVTEAVNRDDKEFSASRLADTIRPLAGRDAKAIADGVLESVQRFVGDVRPHDDLSFVVVKRTA